MKRLLMLLTIAAPFLINGQIKGNKKVVTKTITSQEITDLDVSLYADVIVDMDEEAFLTISIDENLLDKINLNIENGKLKLAQTEWIQPSQKIKIRIGAPSLNRIQQSVHENTRVLNIEREELRVMAILGSLKLRGSVDKLYAAGELGNINATQLDAKIVDINLWDRGVIKLKSPEKITGIVEKDGLVTYVGSDTQVNFKGFGKVKSTSELDKIKNPNARFVKFKIKNNSLNRINCYVVGPKPDGSKFSYGFPLNPGQSRDKDWSIGSKVYRVTGLGTRKLLRVIKPEDEGQTVKLYEKD